jgi:hypothetical protein
VAFKLFNEEWIVVGKHICGRQKVKQLISFLFHAFLVALNVLHHEILSGELVVVRKVIDKLEWLQPVLGFGLEDAIPAAHLCKATGKSQAANLRL